MAEEVCSATYERKALVLPLNFMAATTSPSAYSRLSAIASQRRVHEAFGWLHLHQQQIMGWQEELVAVPAPPFHEHTRANWLLKFFQAAGLQGACIDEEGNCLGIYQGAADRQSTVLISAHIDTVFPPDTPIAPRIAGTRLYAPGACDNGAGIVGMIAILHSLRHAGIEPEHNILFVGNVGEEGEGNLRGIRHIYNQKMWRTTIGSHLVLDGAGHEIAVTQALGSRRYFVTLTGSGGHSWTDAARPNPIVVLSRVITRLSKLDLSGTPRTTLNVGTIEGGSAVNSIPEHAAARFDVRSTAPEQIIRLEVELYRAVEDSVIEANRKSSFPLTYTIEIIGDRPAGSLAKDSSLHHAIEAVDRHLGIRSEMRVASTDANIPLSLAVPAVSIGAGGEGGGIHTRAEWYDAHGRELGLRRALLLLLMMAGY